jgi:hypothetical protein
VAPHLYSNRPANLELGGVGGFFFFIWSGMFFATRLRVHTQDRYHCGGGCNCWLGTRPKYSKESGVVISDPPDGRRRNCRCRPRDICIIHTARRTLATEMSSPLGGIVVMGRILIMLGETLTRRLGIILGAHRLMALRLIIDNLIRQEWLGDMCHVCRDSALFSPSKLRVDLERRHAFLP